MKTDLCSEKKKKDKNTQSSRQASWTAGMSNVILQPSQLLFGLNDNPPTAKRQLQGSDLIAETLLDHYSMTHSV